MQSHQGGFDFLEEAAAAVEDYLPHRKRPLDISGLEKNLRKGDDGRYYWHWDHRMLRHATREKAQHEERLLSAAQAITVPVLLLRGILSDVVSQGVWLNFNKPFPTRVTLTSRKPRIPWRATPTRPSQKLCCHFCKR